MPFCTDTLLQLTPKNHKKPFVIAFIEQVDIMMTIEKGCAALITIFKFILEIDKLNDLIL